MTSQRAFAAEMRVADPGERIIEGIAVPYNSPTTIYENGMLFEEQFAPGAFKRFVARRDARLPILLHHQRRSLPVGKAISMRDTDSGLYIAARISDTTDGNDALTLLRDGVLDGLSIAFYTERNGDKWSSDMSQRTVVEAYAEECSLCNFPAYDSARVLAVRAAQEMVPAHERDVFDDAAEEAGEAMDEVFEQFVPRSIMRARVELLGKV